MKKIELTLTNENNSKVSINESTVCYLVNEGNNTKIQFIGTHQNFIQVQEKYENVLNMLICEK